MKNRNWYCYWFKGHAIQQNQAGNLQEVWLVSGQDRDILPYIYFFMKQKITIGG
jgi:hypothetical protein